MKKYAVLVREDRSKKYLRDWQAQGFETIRIVVHNPNCDECREHANKIFPIDRLLEADNPLFRITHPNCECEMEPVQESNKKHEFYHTQRHYKKKEEEFKKTKPVIPPKTEEKLPEKPEIKLVLPGTEPSPVDSKIRQTEREIAETEKRIEKIEENEEEKEAEGRPKTTAPGSVKNELTKYLDRIKNFLFKLKTEKTKDDINKTEKKLIDIEEEKPKGTFEKFKTSLKDYLDRARKKLYDLFKKKQ